MKKKPLFQHNLRVNSPCYKHARLYFSDNLAILLSIMYTLQSSRQQCPENCLKDFQRHESRLVSRNVLERHGIRVVKLLQVCMGGC